MSTHGANCLSDSSDHPHLLLKSPHHPTPPYRWSPSCSPRRDPDPTSDSGDKRCSDCAASGCRTARRRRSCQCICKLHESNRCTLCTQLTRHLRHPINLTPGGVACALARPSDSYRVPPPSRSPSPQGSEVPACHAQPGGLPGQRVGLGAHAGAGAAQNLRGEKCVHCPSRASG